LSTRETRVTTPLVEQAVATVSGESALAPRLILAASFPGDVPPTPSAVTGRIEP
jgi:hypothetical protein